MASFYEVYPYKIDDKVCANTHHGFKNCIIIKIIDSVTYQVCSDECIIYTLHISKLSLEKPYIRHSSKFYKKHKFLKKHLSNYGKIYNIFHCYAISNNMIQSMKDVKEVSDRYYTYLPIAICINEE